MKLLDILIFKIVGGMLSPNSYTKEKSDFSIYPITNSYGEM
jgi:hypothetical protein